MPAERPTPAAAGSGVVAALVLAPEAAAVGTARRFVREQCEAGGLSPDTGDIAELLTSEVVTNAFTHGRSDARIRVVVSAGAVEVEVGDDNSRHPHVVEEDGGALDGRGMTIVSTLAARWGVRDDPYGKVVWFRITEG